MPIAGYGWGLLGPEELPSTRRTRTLGLGATVRRFNELAVPGIGGVWYGKQLLLATLGVVVAKEARRQGAKVQNIEVTNAIEALACCLAYRRTGWARDARLRGRTKLSGKDADLSFHRVRPRNFYVTQPMRMATAQALPALGIVEPGSARFNTYCASREGREFVEAACGKYSPSNRTVIAHLCKWVLGEADGVDTPALTNALSPLVALADGARPLLRARIEQGGSTESDADKQRRRDALTWVETLHRENRWRPEELDTPHTRDLEGGRRFFDARDKALAVLDTVESYIHGLASGSFCTVGAGARSAKAQIDALRDSAAAFLDRQHEDVDARAFCRECSTDDPASVLRNLVNRDGLVLRADGDAIKRGPAFQGRPASGNSDTDENAETPEGSRSIARLPEGISYRMRNLYLLNLDLQGELGEWLKKTGSTR